MKKLLSIAVVILTPILGIWVAFARDLPLPDVPLYVGLPLALGAGGLGLWIFKKSAWYLFKNWRK